LIKKFLHTTFEALPYFKAFRTSLKMRGPNYSYVENEYYDSANNNEEEDEL
jgi:hypothetical protein